MESRKMVLMNCFPGSNGDADVENRPVDLGAGAGRKERARRREGVAWQRIHHHM